MSQTETIRASFKECINKLNEIDTRSKVEIELNIGNEIN
jgi:hypothetical protein